MPSAQIQRWLLKQLFKIDSRLKVGLRWTLCNKYIISENICQLIKTDIRLFLSSLTVRLNPEDQINKTLDEQITDQTTK